MKFNTTPPIAEASYWPVQPQMSDVLAAIRSSNDILRSIDAALRASHGDMAVVSGKSDALILAERVEWLERQVAEIKERD